MTIEDNCGYRVESDCLGEMKIREDSYYGINTVRAQENFNISSFKVNRLLIRAIAAVKKAAVQTNLELGYIEEDKAEAIAKACSEVIEDILPCEYELDAYQGGAGTSTNMMVNEVVANRALEIMGCSQGDYDFIHPNDDVNRGQSTNDVYPTALRIAVLQLLNRLTETTADLQQALQEKEREFADIVKLGRTELQDAVPITLGQEFSAYAEALGRDRWRLYKIEERLKSINLGGTAVGTGLNTSQSYIFKVTRRLRQITGLSLSHAENMIDLTQNMDIFVEVSGLLKSLAVNLNKIANDIRLLSSGPGGGFGELKIPKVQVGSSIMPGKVNPVICEMINQIYIEIISSDLALTQAAASGQLELNSFIPLIAHKLLSSMEILNKGIKNFNEKCIMGIKADRERIGEHLENSLATINNLLPVLGYDLCSKIVNQALHTGKGLKEIIRENNYLQSEDIQNIFSIKNLTRPGKYKSYE